MKVYADNAATTAMSDNAKNAMLHCMDEIYGNPSSLHVYGRAAAGILHKSRETIAQYLNADAKEIYFTSGGSEANNQAIISAASVGAKKGKKHIISTKFEHHAVLHTLENLKKQGFEITLLNVYSNGIVKTDDIRSAIREDTVLVTIMCANNEIGTIQPISEIGRICRDKEVLFHTDAVQAAGHLKIDVKEQGVDMLSISAHKFHGPKGIGVLYCRRGIPLESLIVGGSQERGKRAGTENIPAIAGLAEGFKESCLKIDDNAKYVCGLRDKLIYELSKIPHSTVNGDITKRLPGNVNMCFEGIEGETLIIVLDSKGIAASSGSACASGSLDPSHVLLALGLSHEAALGSLRLSLSEYNTREEIDYMIHTVPKVVSYLREMSPTWEKIQMGENYNGV